MGPLSSTSRAFLTAALLAALGCGANVVVEPDDDGQGAGASDPNGGQGGAGGPDPVMGGHGGTGGGEGGTGGAPVSNVVPGCEELIPVGPLFGLPGSFQGRIGAIDGEALGAVYMYNVGFASWETRSRRVLHPFGAWPPDVSEEVVHENQAFHDDIEVRDGYFATASYVARFGEPGIDLDSVDGYHRPILEPSPRQGFYWYDGSGFDYHPSIDGSLPDYRVDTGELHPYVVGFDAESRVLLQSGSQLYAIDGPALAPLVTVPTNLSDVAVYPGPHGLLHVGSDRGLIAVAELTSTGLSNGLHPFGDIGFFDFASAPWRGGVALFAAGSYSPDEPPIEYAVAVTDGAHVTTATMGVDAYLCQNGLSLAVAPDGNSLVVGYLRCGQDADDTQFVLQRFDCASTP